jgi:hypothetical protein
LEAVKTANQNSQTTDLQDPVTNIENEITPMDVVEKKPLQTETVLNGLHNIHSEIKAKNDIARRLNYEQNLAYMVVTKHSELEESRIQQKQLLLNIQGEPGTGKSEIIKAITRYFELKGKPEQILKTAQTGIAASSIGGETLHAFTKIPVSGGDPSRKSLYSLGIRIKSIRYLIIDEISMVSKQFFAQIERVLSMARDLVKDEIGSTHRGLFGGLNVIIVGDFHQFGPIAKGKTASLFSTRLPTRRINQRTRLDMQAGFQLYRQFDEVVLLTKQMRTQDPVWENLLKHVRFGKCQNKHLEILRELIIDPDNRDEDLHERKSENAPVLVTPRHVVRRAWNRESLTKHCQTTRNRKIIIESKDTIKGRELSLQEKIAAIQSKKPENKNTSSKPEDDETEKQGLADKLEVAIGAEVMVTTNVDTQHGIANGARGIVTALCLDSEDHPTNSQNPKMILAHLPTYMIVKFHHNTRIKFEGLDENEYPLRPIQKSYYITMDDKKVKRVNRLQYPLTLGYSFTDYRAQGQTIPNLIVDIGKTPTGSISQLNAYVALSRSRGRSSIRLLRNFQNEIIQTPPDQELIDEDIRLKMLGKQTQRNFEIELGML